MLADYRKKTFFMWAALLLAVVSTSPVSAQSDTDQLAPPNRYQTLVSRVVAQIMEQHHLSKLPLDDTISKRAFGLYVKGLDPTKSYFMRSDIDEFEQAQGEIDDQMKRGEFELRPESVPQIPGTGRSANRPGDRTD